MPDDINKLISSLDSSDKKERNEAIKKLKEAGSAGSVPLLKVLNSSSEQVRIAAAEILGTYSKDNIETFLNLLKTGNKNVKDGAARTIAQIAKGGVPVYEFLSAMIKDENCKSREGAALVLGYTGRNDKNTINMLLSLFRDPNKDVREEAVKSLDAIKWKSLNQTENAYYFLIKEDWSSLGRLGAYSIPALSFGIEISDSNIKKEIAGVLARINDESANPLLMLLLNDSNSSVRLSAVAAIAEKRDNSLFPLLVQSMYDSDPNVRVEASWSLEKAGWKPQKFSEKTRSLMLRGNYKEVESMGDKAIPCLIEFLGDDIYERRENAYKILYSFGKPGIDAIKNASNDSDASIKNGAQEALAYVREEEVKKEENKTEAILNGSKISFKQNSYEYWEEKLIQAGFGIEITQVLSKALSSEDSVVRIVAIDNLKKFGKNSSEIFLLLTDDDNENIQIAAIETLGEIYEKKAIPKLIEKIEDDNGKIRRACAYSLGKLRDAATIPVLIRHFSDDDENVRYECSRAVAKMGNSAIPYIENLIFHSNELIRVSSLNALGEISDPCGIPLATRSLNDQDNNVRNEAMQALLKFSNFMFNFLMMEVHRVCIQGTKMEKLGMLSVLSKTGDMKIVPFVREYLGDEDEEVKRNARTILDIFTEREIKKEREKIKEYSHETASLLRRKLTLDDIDRLLDRVLNANDTDALAILSHKLDQKEIDELIRNAKSTRKQDTSKLLGKKLSQDEIDELLHKSVYVDNKKTTQLLGKKLTQDEIDSLIHHASSEKEEKAAKDIKKQLTQNEIDDIIKKELEIRKKVAMEVSRLIIGLRSEISSERKRHSDKIVKIGEPAVEPLISTLNTADPDFQDMIAEILIKIGKPGIRGMLRVLNYGNSSLKIIVAKKIAEIDDKEAVSALYDRIYTEKDPEVKCIFIEYFGKTSDKRVFDIMSYALLDKNPQVRFEAVKVLARLKDKRAIEPLISLFEDPDQNIRDMAVSALKPYSKGAEKPLLEALRSGKKDLYKENVARALEQAGVIPKNKEDVVYFLIAKNNWDKIIKEGDVAIKPLQDVLNDLYSVKRKDALKSIIAINTDKSIIPLANALFDMDNEISGESRKAILKRGAAVLPQLKEITAKNNDDSEKEQLINLINEIEEKELIKSYIAAGKWDELEKIGPHAVVYLSKLIDEKNDNLRLNAVRTIGKISTPESVNPLIAAIFDENKKVSDTAKAYLIKYGRDALPYIRKRYESISEPENIDSLDQIINIIEQNERIKNLIINENWNALKREGPPALGALRVIMRSRSPEKRLNAVLVISEIDSQKSIIELINALFDEDEKVLNAAKKGLVKKGDKGLNILTQAEKTMNDPVKKEILKEVIHEISNKITLDENSRNNS